MPLNQALVGKEYPAVRYEVGREKLREFAESVGETDPIYHDEEAAHAAGHPDIPAVPTFPIVLTRRVGQKVYEDPELGLDYSRVVHGEQEFTYHRPIFAGDRLLAAGRVAAVQVKGRHELLAIETRVTTEQGEPVCSAVVTLIARGTASAAPAATDPGGSADPATSTGSAGGPA
jgi:acyl dehydratase